MPFLPSLLEYTPQALETKLQLITSHLAEFQIIQKSPDEKIYLHLDFVLAEFAASRNIEPGNSPDVVLELIHKYFHDQKLVCNSHFMGSAKDTARVLEFFKTYNWNPNWKFVLYVGHEFVEEFEKEIKPLAISPSGEVHEPLSTPSASLPPLKRGNNQGQIPNRIKIGAWLDLDQYDLNTKFELQDYLLMTVYAGKSGQKLTEEVRLNTLNIIQKNPELSFTIDGGWAINDELKELNLDIKNKLSVVSYTSFWKEFEKLITK
jgi:hypothetical protein